MIDYILWDVDNTLLDFHESEKVAIEKCFDEFSIKTVDDEMISRYSSINKKYWKKLELGEITRSQVLVGRFREFFKNEGIDTGISESFNDRYQELLGETCVFMDDSINLLKDLKKMGYRQYAVTNGTKIAQKKKLSISGIGEVLDGVFISEDLGHEKPGIEFFDIVLSKIFEYNNCDVETLGLEDKDKFIIIGDSLTSDIKGGMNAQIHTCWYNPTHQENDLDIVPEFEVDDLWKIQDIIK